MTLFCLDAKLTDFFYFIFFFKYQLHLITSKENNKKLETLDFGCSKSPTVQHCWSFNHNIPDSSYKLLTACDVKPTLFFYQQVIVISVRHQTMPTDLIQKGRKRHCTVATILVPGGGGSLKFKIKGPPTGELLNSLVAYNNYNNHSNGQPKTSVHRHTSIKHVPLYTQGVQSLL